MVLGTVGIFAGGVLGGSSLIRRSISVGFVCFVLVWSGLRSRSGYETIDEGFDSSPTSVKEPESSTRLLSLTGPCCTIQGSNPRPHSTNVLAQIGGVLLMYEILHASLATRGYRVDRFLVLGRVTSKNPKRSDFLDVVSHPEGLKKSYQETP